MCPVREYGVRRITGTSSLDDWISYLVSIPMVTTPDIARDIASVYPVREHEVFYVTGN